MNVGVAGLATGAMAAIVTLVAVTQLWPQPGPVSASAVAAVAAGSASGHTSAVTTAGGLKCWGRNTHGQLGDGRACGIVCVTPVDALGLESGVVRVVAAGWAHTCALTTAGGVKCWGNNFHGQLGNGELGNFITTPVGVGLLASDVAAVAAGDWHTCAVTTVGGVKCWGENLHGQLGDGTFGTDRTSPVNVLGLSSGVVAVAGGEFHSCALTNAGGVKCWGRNEVGQVGDGTISGISTIPEDVADLSSDGVAIAAGGRHSCAVTTTGGAKCWGYNGLGQLGDGTTTTRATPVDVLGLVNAIAIVAGHSHTCEVVQCWGINSSGQLGSTTIETCNTVPCSTSPLTVEMVDSDGDGCTDKAELQVAAGSELTGGLRDPENRWDFFDVNGDGNIDVPNDLLPVISAYRQGPLDPGGPEPNYTAAKDRGPPIAGAQFSWQRTGPDGHIDVPNDILPITLQYLHNCK